MPQSRKKTVPKTAPKKSVKEEKHPFRVSVTINGDTQHYDCDDVLEGLLKVETGLVKTDAQVVLRSLAGLEASRRLNALQVRRMFRNKTALELLAKNLRILLG